MEQILERLLAEVRTQIGSLSSRMDSSQEEVKAMREKMDFN
jgi:hypothetical protein